MKSPARFIHDQVIGFMRAGKEWEPAENAVERAASKGVAGLLVVVGIALAIVPLFLDFLPARVALRALVVSTLVFGLAARFWHGISVASVIAGMFRYWLPVGFLIYMYVAAGKIAIALFKLGESPDYLYPCGIMIVGMALLGGITSWVHVGVVRERATSAGTSARAKIFGLRAYALLWFAFFLGGLWTLAMAIGLADWIMVDVFGL